MRLRHILAALALTAAVGSVAEALSAPVASAASGGSGRVPAGFAGVMANGPLFDSHINLAHQLDVMVASGVESVRASFNWSIAQPYASFADVPATQRSEFQDLGGVPTQFANLDAIVGLAAARGLTILPVVEAPPDWASQDPGVSGTPPSSPAPYAAFARQLVLRYGPHGTYWHAHPRIKPLPIRLWQVWNEPNISAAWSQQPFVHGYVALLRAARTAIKRADPGAKIVLGGLTNYCWLDLARVYADPGARALFDIVAVHPYTAQPSGVIEILQKVRAVMKSGGDSRKPLLVTEMGWPSSLGQTTIFGFETTESGQASKVAAVLPLLAANRRALVLQGFYYYTWASDDRPRAYTFDFAGLLEFQTTRLVPKPALAAFRRGALGIERCKQKTRLATRCARPG